MPVDSTAAANPALRGTRIFVSYSRKDMAFADRLEAALKGRGFEPLIDRTEIFAFEDWWKRIEALIGRADTVVFVLSPDAVASDVALKEVAYAASLNKRFAPVVCKPVADSAVPEALRRLNFIFFDDPARFEGNADALATALQTDIGWMRRHTELGEAARRWAGAGLPNGLLLRSPVLEEAEAWIAYRPHGAPPPTEETQKFIAESRKAEIETRKSEARARTWRRRAQAAIYVLLVGIIGGLVGWINQAYVKDQLNWFMTMRPYAVANIWPYVLTAEAERALKPLASFRECAKDCPEMIVIPAGQFTMGSPPIEGRPSDERTNEEPQHKVTIARPFAVSQFDVTAADWEACISVGGCTPESGQDQRRMNVKIRLKFPVINVNWDEAQQYVAWLSRMTGQPYRLLTEAEWEYAARAGTTTAYYWGDEIGTGNANCQGCGGVWDHRLESSPVGRFTPNAFGLYDMAGNVWQWVEDCYEDDYEDAHANGSARRFLHCNNNVVRGGSFDGGPGEVRSASRTGTYTDTRRVNLGFRVARTLLRP
jgi:formylglycine-generating enzyme required for sulfatase activity